MADYIKRAAPAPGIAEEVRRTVADMLRRIEERGEDAVRDYSLRLDGWAPDSFRLTPDDMERAAAEISDDLRTQIAFAQEQVRTFARRQRETLADLQVETLPGVVLGHRHIPIASVGCYVPGGRYPMLASAFMTVLVAKEAGVARVVGCAPPREGRGVHPAMAYAMATSGADELVCLGGVQALAAMAFGLSDLAPVDMIVGAGNAYVAEAKRQLFGRVGIDLLAGPTEILVIADGGADPALVAADLLGQAEHGPTSPAGLVTTDRALGLAVDNQVERLLGWWPTAAVARPAWRDFGWIGVVEDRDEAVSLANEWAPEHLEVQVDERELAYYLDHLTNFGSLFLGAEATVAYGDKAVGTNHVLPTGRAARYTGGLWVGKFLKTATYQRLDKEGTRQVAPAVAAISRAESFLGHAITADMRLERAGDEEHTSGGVAT